jgi:phage tail sheath gpL-like
VTRQLFALECYDRSGGRAAPEPMSLPTTADTRLVSAVYLPADEVVLALVEGPDAETVAAVAAAAGWRVDRLSPATWLTRQHPEPATNAGGQQ